MKGLCNSQREKITEEGPFSFFERVRITNVPEGFKGRARYQKKNSEERRHGKSKLRLNYGQRNGTEAD